MRISNHVCFTRDNKRFCRYLDKNRIPYDDSGTGILILDIFEDEPHWNEISRLIKTEHILYITDTVFTKEELAAAPWLRVRSQWHYDNSDMLDNYMDIVYDAQEFCSACGSGYRQKDNFRFKKTPSWGKRYFLTMIVANDLFVSEKTKEILQATSFCGFSFEKVKNKSGSEYLSDMYQLVVSSVLPNGLAEDSKGLRFRYKCSNCGRIKAQENGRGKLTYNKEAFENAADIVKTGEWFGNDALAHRYILIRQPVYRFLVENHMERALAFEPIVLV